MRLGGLDINILEASIAHDIYNSLKIRERHRHRYEFNQKYKDIFEENGIVFSGTSDKGKRIEICEIPSHVFFIAVQYHPEFISRPGLPEPVFSRFISAAINSKK
jgi:CTP synthase